VLYSTSGTNIAACVIDTKNLPAFEVDGQKIQPKGIVADMVTYNYRTDSAQEAFYLVGILSSRVINERIKESQPRGSFGPRHIAKRALEFPFPLFDPQNRTHLRVAELTRTLISQSEVIVDSGIRGRKRFRDGLKGIDELDGLIEKLLKDGFAT